MAEIKICEIKMGFNPNPIASQQIQNVDRALKVKSLRGEENVCPSQSKEDLGSIIEILWLWWWCMRLKMTCQANFSVE